MAKEKDTDYFDMKRYKIKLEEITSIENCKKAILKASKGKQHRRDVKRILTNVDKYANELSKFIEDVLDGTKELEQGNVDTVIEGVSRKLRTLCKPRYYPEQRTHWAIMLQIAPLLEKSFYKYSCASIKGRGTHYAKYSVQHFLRDTKNTKYCLQVDVKGFYKHINKETLISMLSNKFKDKRVVNLLSKVIYAYKGDGLPLGYYTSAHLANFYLTGYDRYLKEVLKVKYMARYMDDVVIYGSNKRVLHKVKVLSEEYLKPLSLFYKTNWQVYKMPYDNKKGKITSQRFTDFVGYKFYRYKTIIRKSIFLRMVRLFRKLTNGKYTSKRAHAFYSYNGYIQHTNSVNVTSNYINGKINLNKLKEIIRNESRNKNSVNCAAG